MNQDAENFKKKVLFSVNLRLTVTKKQMENSDNSEYINSFLSHQISALEDVIKDIESTSTD